MKLLFVLDQFAAPGPAQQLLDRFLMGYPRDGKFHQAPGLSVTACVRNPIPGSELERRANDYQLNLEPDLAKAAANADGIVVVSAEPGIGRAVINAARENSSCFIFGRLANTLSEANDLVASANRKRIGIFSGTALPVTWRLPHIDLPHGTRVKQALLVAQGAFPAGETEAVDALLALVGHRRGGEQGVKHVQFFRGEGVWKAGARGLWSWPLLASALSRSDTPQGDPVKDGRTQDLVGLGLVPKLAKDPRAWILEHTDGLRSAILMLDGVVADFNIAWETPQGIESTQLFRPPKPFQHEFSYLAAVLEDNFQTGHGTPWPVKRNVLASGLHEVFGLLLARRTESTATPQLWNF